MYKTGKEIELTRELFRQLRSSDFSPEGSVRKAKISFKRGSCTKVCDAVLESIGDTSIVWYILPPAENGCAVHNFVSRAFGRCRESERFTPTVSEANWYYGSTYSLQSWLDQRTNSLSITFTGNPVKAERLSGIKTIFNTDCPDVKNEVGSELELEATTPELADFMCNTLRNKVREISKLHLVDNIGRDCSVRGFGPEIRFKHPSLGKWRKDAIERVISAMKDVGFSAGRSAGQHVHVSHPKIKVAIYKSKNDIDGMNDFLKPVSCRHPGGIYGVGTNIMRDQFMDFKTLEIRVWESTTNVDLFKKRLRFSNALVKRLVHRGIDYKNIWTKMSKTMGEDYVDMLFIDNPHLIGLSINDVMSRLPDSLKAYAREKYGWNSPQ